MRKILALAIALLLLVLSVAPVSAQGEPQVTMQGSGSFLVEPDVNARVAVYIDTATGIVQMRFSFPGGWMRYEQFVTGLCIVAEVTGWEVDGNTVTVYIAGEAFWLPSREPITGAPGEMWVVGELTGPGNRGEISVWPTPGADLSAIPGTIIIR